MKTQEQSWKHTHTHIHTYIHTHTATSKHQHRRGTQTHTQAHKSTHKHRHTHKNKRKNVHSKTGTLENEYRQVFAGYDAKIHKLVKLQRTCLPATLFPNPPVLFRAQVCEALHSNSVPLTAPNTYCPHLYFVVFFDNDMQP